MAGGRQQRCNLATQPPDFAVPDHHIGVGHLHATFPQAFHFPALQYHTRFEFFFDGIVMTRFFVKRDTIAGGLFSFGFFRHG